PSPPEAAAAPGANPDAPEDPQLPPPRGDVDEHAVSPFRADHSEPFEAPRGPRLEVVGFLTRDVDADLAGGRPLCLRDRRDDLLRVEAREAGRHRLPAPGGAAAAEAAAASGEAAPPARPSASAAAPSAAAASAAEDHREAAAAGPPARAGVCPEGAAPAEEPRDHEEDAEDDDPRQARRDLVGAAAAIGVRPARALVLSLPGGHERLS